MEDMNPAQAGSEEYPAGKSPPSGARPDNRVPESPNGREKGSDASVSVCAFDRSVSVRQSLAIEVSVKSCTISNMDRITSQLPFSPCRARRRFPLGGALFP